MHRTAGIRSRGARVTRKGEKPASNSHADNLVTALLNVATRYTFGVDRLRELVRFGLVGAFNAGTYFGLYTAGVLGGVPYLLSAVVAFAISASLGYWLHEHWTFKGGRPTTKGWISWLAAQATATALNLLLLAGAVDGLGANAIVAQAVLLPITPAATYLVGRRWVFSRA